MTRRSKKGEAPIQNISYHLEQKGLLNGNYCGTYILQSLAIDHEMIDGDVYEITTTKGTYYINASGIVTKVDRTKRSNDYGY